MKTLKQQIAAVNSALRTFKNFEMDEGMPGDGLRDAATTLIALDLITSDRKTFFADFATKLRSGVGPSKRTAAHFTEAVDIMNALNTFLVEKGLLPPDDPKKGTREKVGAVALHCFDCAGIGFVGPDLTNYCPTCGGTGVPKEGNAGYGFVGTTLVGLKKPRPIKRARPIRKGTLVQKLEKYLDNAYSRPKRKKK